jgi:methyltransferase (TIGR00027 family)
MEENQFSRTALITACIRAYHAAYDDPRIFDDFLAHRLITEAEYASLELHDCTSPQPAEASTQGLRPKRAAALKWWIKVIAGTIIARARYAEDALERAIQQGIEQYVILGAGMDTFAIRRPELLRHFRVFEVDHPATQGFKRRRLTQVGIEPPDGLEFVSLDFAKESLSAALKRSSYDPNALTFFSWQGVTYYLSRHEVMTTFRSVSDCARPGSSIVFDYLDEGFFAPENPHQSVHLVLANVRRVGEAMKSGFNPEALATNLVRLGLYIREDLNPTEIERKFFTGRTDGYHAGQYIHFARAEVV